ncbi:MAG: type 1 glutamine amidotransferase, partial [Planctomycetota bacterium]
EGGPWLPAALEAMRELHDLNKPTFASCWGFQAMAKALGGEVITDRSRAELGAVEIQLTDAGREDPIFGGLDDRFLAPMGHQDCVTKLPPKAVLLASSEKVENQAFCIEGKPIYCTQFHPELDRASLLQRLRAYPKYVKEISGKTIDAFEETLGPTPATDTLLTRFMQHLRTTPAFSKPEPVSTRESSP